MPYESREHLYTEEQLVRFDQRNRAAAQAWQAKVARERAEKRGPAQGLATKPTLDGAAISPARRAYILQAAGLPAESEQAAQRPATPTLGHAAFAAAPEECDPHLLPTPDGAATSPQRAAYLLNVAGVTGSF